MLIRVFGRDTPPFVTPVTELVHTSTNTMSQLSSAIRWASRMHRMDDEASTFLDQMPEPEWRPKTEVEIPTDDEVSKIEQAIRKTLPPNRAAVVMLPLELGLRADEVISLRHEWVQRAYQYGELKVLRKGGKEQMLPAKHAQQLFADLLKAGKATSLNSVERQMAEHRAAIKHYGSASFGDRWGANTDAGRWKTVGEIISAAKPSSQYHQLYELTKKVGLAAGVVDLHPHKLRHVFATRMVRKGAPLSMVQWMLGHSSPATTGRYLHPTAQDVSKYL